MRHLLISCALLGSGCIELPDVPACRDIPSRVVNREGRVFVEASPLCWEHTQELSCGHCVYIKSGREVFVGESEKTRLFGKKWSELRDQSVLLPAAESYAPLSVYLINSCKRLKCDGSVEKFLVKIK